VDALEEKCGVEVRSTRRDVARAPTRLRSRRCSEPSSLINRGDEHSRNTQIEQRFESLGSSVDPSTSTFKSFMLILSVSFSVNEILKGISNSCAYSSLSPTLHPARLGVNPHPNKMTSSLHKVCSYPCFQLTQYHLFKYPGSEPCCLQSVA
jgi:hypothetical protein